MWKAYVVADCHSDFSKCGVCDHRMIARAVSIRFAILFRFRKRDVKHMILSYCETIRPDGSIMKDRLVNRSSSGNFNASEPPKSKPRNERRRHTLPPRFDHPLQRQNFVLAATRTETQLVTSGVAINWRPLQRPVEP